MNNFSTVCDFLLHNQKLHSRIAEFYRELSAQANSERVKMLLNILIKHEIELSTSLCKYIEKSPAKILDTFFQYDREHDVEYLFATVAERSQISSDEVETLANRFDQYFSELYEGMESEVDADSVEALFKNLHQEMEEEKKRLSTDMNSMEDM